MWTSTILLSLGIFLRVQGTFDRTCTVTNGCIVDSSDSEEIFRPVSQSPVWSRLSFNDHKKLTSRPALLSSNAFLANAYAKTLWNVFLDMQSSFNDVKNRDEPLYLLDLDAGSGKFSHLVLQALLEIQDRLPFSIEKKLKYVLTSQHAAQIEAWKVHPDFQFYIDHDMMDFALWNPTTVSEPLILQLSQTQLSSTLAHPILVIANQVLSHQSVDIFRMTGGKSLELAEEYIGSSDIYEPVNTRTINEVDQVYQSKSWTILLQWYETYFQANSLSSRFPFPVSSLHMLENLQALANGQNVIILAADRGQYAPTQWHFDPSSREHQDILIEDDDDEALFSTIVNFHMLGLYCALQGGYALHTPQRDSMLSVSTLILNPASVVVDTKVGSESSLTQHHESLSKSTYPKFHYAFHENFVRFTPHDFHVLFNAIIDEPMEDYESGLLSLLKLSRWDPDVFHHALPHIKSIYSDLAIETQADVILGLRKTERQAFFIGQVDTHFDIGVVHYLYRDYERAVELYTQSMTHFGAQKGTWYNIGICHAELKDFRLAIEAFDQALKLDGNYASAQIERKKALKKLDKDEL